MTSCTRQISTMAPVDIQQLGKASINASVPELPALSGKRIAVIGGGPAGISIAWQLRQKGHEATIYDMGETLGGKLAASIPNSRIPKEVVSAELERIQEIIPHVNLKQELKKEDMEKLEGDYDAVVVAVGAQRPRTLPVPGADRMITALDFLVAAKTDGIKPGKRVVIIGAGNVGCDVATEAHRLGAKDITLLDVQKPASFGKEREDAEAVGAKFKWPVFTKEITEEGVVLQSGELIPADTVFISIGDQPNIDFLPESVEIDRGFVKVNDFFQTTAPKIFAVGDVARPGLLTDAIGAGRTAAQAIIDILSDTPPTSAARPMIDKSRVTLEYFDPRIQSYEDVDHCGEQCASCGACRDCGACVAICPETAISRLEKENGEYEYAVNGEKCIGCGFCAQACPCGVWNLVENEPME
jgi:NADPH-dependent glutamate synthase beta subunit-like oxidoreductase/ferredoxin